MKPPIIWKDEEEREGDGEKERRRGEREERGGERENHKLAEKGGDREHEPVDEGQERCVILPLVPLTGQSPGQVCSGQV